MKNLKITVNGVSYDVQVEEVGGTAAPAMSAPAAAPAQAAASAPAAVPAPAAAPAPAASGAIGDEKVLAPMPGTILSVNVKPGDKVKSGTVLVILEAMKMENEIMASSDGTVVSVNVNKGEAVESGTLLVSMS
ncbi:MAG: biotin/lipoyl-binding protein [Oscillospiraceae bacterium]|nr:biotin/lipoyl-binding protein [Oscillospiraceae bacterium]